MLPSFFSGEFVFFQEGQGREENPFKSSKLFSQYKCILMNGIFITNGSDL